eukprot:sb/3470233/
MSRGDTKGAQSWKGERAFHEQMKKDRRESCEQSDQLMKYRWVLILLQRQCRRDYNLGALRLLYRCALAKEIDSPNRTPKPNPNQTLTVSPNPLRAPKLRIVSNERHPDFNYDDMGGRELSGDFNRICDCDRSVNGLLRPVSVWRRRPHLSALSENQMGYGAAIQTSTGKRTYTYSFTDDRQKTICRSGGDSKRMIRHCAVSPVRRDLAV